MSAFVIFHSTVKDPEKFQIYGKSVGATLKPFGGEIYLRGKVASVLAGDHGHKNVAVLSFPDAEAATGWYNSPEYQQLVKNRDEAADIVAIAYAAPPA